jgi:hypothetical protein
MPCVTFVEHKCARSTCLAHAAGIALSGNKFYVGESIACGTTRKTKFPKLIFKLKFYEKNWTFFGKLLKIFGKNLKICKNLQIFKNFHRPNDLGVGGGVPGPKFPRVGPRPIRNIMVSGYVCHFI